MQIVTRPLIAALLLGATIVAAGAQSEDGTRNAPPDKIQPRTARPGDGTTQPQQQPNSGSSQAPGSLSDQLRRSGGVLTPPNEGASRTPVIPPPNEGSSSTPVIPPPGTPGGNPDIQPK
jgi:hypothetical protein